MGSFRVVRVLALLVAFGCDGGRKDKGPEAASARQAVAAGAPAAPPATAGRDWADRVHVKSQIHQTRTGPAPVSRPRRDKLRSGRLTADETAIDGESGDDRIAHDVGIDGGAASAEEAAVHLIDEP